jgi:hypothetical protein
MLLRLAQSLTTRRKQRRLGLKARLFHYRKHRNSYLAVLCEITEAFAVVDGYQVMVRRWPFRFLSWNFNLWAVITILTPSNIQ